MRSVKFLVAAGAASLLSSAAFAADLPAPPPYAPPPVEDFGGWYLRGDIGMSNQSVKSMKLSDPTYYQNLTSYDQTTNFDAAPTYQIGVGYQFNNWFRADITGQYRGSSNFKGTDLITFPSSGAIASGSDNYSASKSEWLFLANVYADLGTWWCVTPFIGAGVGAARVSISGFTDSGITNANVGYVGGPPVASFASAASGSQWNFAWALHAGLGYRISPNATLEVAYSYVNLGDGVTGVASTFDGSSGGDVFKFHNITSQDVTFGIRWDLDNPAVYAPPPLITKG
ncbi:MAG TPA: outer membrane beta-barrel protein [Bradyrhizobium sp.]|nr:outer membrane beta-barrel protein [Bradyrhizobium sp.]